MTAHRSIESAVETIRRGAFDFIVKPLDLSHVDLSIERALRLRTVQKENIPL